MLIDLTDYWLDLDIYIFRHLIIAHPCSPQPVNVEGV